MTSTKTDMSEEHDEKPVEDAPVADESAAVEPTLEEQLAHWQDQFMRVQADVQNMRKRMEQDVEDRVQLRLEALLYDLIRVADYMEAALGSIPEGVRSADQADSFLAGMDAIRMALDGVMLGHGMVFLAPAEGAEFNPDEHEAVETVEVDDLAAPRMELLGRGYRIGRRILRPAKVRLQQPKGS